MAGAPDRPSKSGGFLGRLFGKPGGRPPGEGEAESPAIDSVEGAMKVRAAVDFNALASQTNSASLQESAKVERLQKMLAVLADASEALLACNSLDETLHRVLDLVFGHMPVERGYVLLWDDARGELKVTCSKRSKKAGPGSADAPFSRTIVNDAYSKKVAILTVDAQNDPRFMTMSVQTAGIRSAMAAPLVNGSRVEGVIYVDTPIFVKAYDEFDVDLLSALANHVAVAIEHARLQDSVVHQTLVRQRLERYHSPAVVDRIVGETKSGGDELMADERDVTVLFADMVDFTKRSEGMVPRDVASMLNRYFSELAEVILKHEGTLDKFIGDCVMAVFGAPIAEPDHAARAVAAALDMRDALARVNADLPEAARMQFRVGIHSGRVIAGDLGSVRRSDYTAVGSTVNLAARIESSIAQPGQIVISSSTHDATAGQFVVRPAGEFTPKGFATPVACFEVLSRAV
jgi:adenylate cyclase